METAPLQADLSRYIVALPHDEFLPRNAPREKLELMVHHAQIAAQDEAYGKIEREIGLNRDELVHQRGNKCLCICRERPRRSWLEPGNFVGRRLIGTPT